MKTTGDKRQDVSFTSLDGKGLFIKELEEALDRRDIDIVVHSLKDVPSIIPGRFALAAFLERADPRDTWVHRDHASIADLPRGAVIGTPIAELQTSRTIACTLLPDRNTRTEWAPAKAKARIVTTLA